MSTVRFTIRRVSAAISPFPSPPDYGRRVIFARVPDAIERVTRMRVPRGSAGRVNQVRARIERICRIGTRQSRRVARCYLAVYSEVFS
jgi:hypothetical protein